MNRLGIGHFGCGDNGWNIQIALRRRCRSDADGFVGQLDVFCVAIHIGVHRHGAYAHLAASTLYPQGDFAAVGDQNFCEHGRLALLDDDQRLAVFNRLPVVDQKGLDHPILVRLDLVHQLHRFNDADHLSRFHGVTDLGEGF